MSTGVISADSLYDPEFTADISNKMQVPQRISVIDQPQAPEDQPKQSDALLYMHVPDRILVTGAGHRSGMPEARPDPRPDVQLSTPPRNLTLDAHSYPSVEDDDETWDGDHNQAVKLRQRTTLSSIPNGELHSGLGSAPTTPPGIFHAEDDLSAMRKQMRTLSRRLMLLEQDNQQRQQREVVLYSVGVLYFLLKGLVWLQRHW